MTAPKKPVPAVPGVVDLSNPGKAEYWCVELCCRPSELSAAVSEGGSLSASAVMGRILTARARRAMGVVADDIEADENPAPPPPTPRA